MYIFAKMLNLQPHIEWILRRVFFLNIQIYNFQHFLKAEQQQKLSKQQHITGVRLNPMGECVLDVIKKNTTRLCHLNLTFLPLKRNNMVLMEEFHQHIQKPSFFYVSSVFMQIQQKFCDFRVWANVTLTSSQFHQLFSLENAVQQRGTLLPAHDVLG